MKIFKKFIFVSFLAIFFSLIIASLFPEEASHKYFYQAPWFKFLWFIVSIGIIIVFVNSVQRRDFGFSIIYLGLLLVLLAGLLASLFKEEGFMEMKKGQTQDDFWINDESSKSLGFSLSLKDFSVEFYPKEVKGMRFIKAYKTSVGISRNGKLLKEATIEVNKPLTFEGFWFYQYGYEPKLPEQTVLQVVKDPGLPLAYSGYIILMVGLVFSFRRLWKI